MTHYAVPTVNLMLIKDGQILLSRRANTGWMDGHLVIPVGHIEANETPVQAIIREAKEELGTIIKPEDLAFVCVAVRNKKPEEHIAFEFKVDGKNIDVTNQEPDRCSELVWVNLSELPEDVVPDFRTNIEHGLTKGNTYIEVGY